MLSTAPPMRSAAAAADNATLDFFASCIFIFLFQDVNRFDLNV
jgi:hypothetical protein